VSAPRRARVAATMREVGTIRIATQNSGRGRRACPGRVIHSAFRPYAILGCSQERADSADVEVDEIGGVRTAEVRA
jgi:hypothetical protein